MQFIVIVTVTFYTYNIYITTIPTVSHLKEIDEFVSCHYGIEVVGKLWPSVVN